MKRTAIVCLLLASALFGAGNRRIPVASSDKVFPHIAVGGSWTTVITLVNVWSEPAQFNLRLWDDNGQPLNVSVTGVGNVSQINGTIPVGGSRTYEITGGVNTVSGWAELNYDWSIAEIGGMAVFRQSVGGRPDFEAVVPVSSVGVSDFAIPFDNRSGFVSGVALANPDNIPARYEVTFRDDDGNAIGEPVEVTLAAKGHTAFVLDQRFSQVRGRKGTAFFQLVSGEMTGLGLRFNPTNAFTSTHTLDF
jgi:hypothetical protein